MQDVTWKLDELAERAGVSARTVRYYVQRGLLPAPQFRGRDTAYGAAHLTRLKAIRTLQKRFLPLDAIEAELGRATDAELTALAEGADAEPVSLPRVPATSVEKVTRAAEQAPRWERLQLSPEVELHVSDRADATTRARVEELLELARRLGFSKGVTR
jgi:DNA-binding transcriptional MerR regulator